MQLLQASVSDDLADWVGNDLGRERNGHGQVTVVLGHGDEAEIFQVRPAVKLLKTWEDKSFCYLPHPVWPKVKGDDCVLILDSRDGFAVGTGNNCGYELLVVHAFAIARPDKRQRVW